MRVVERIHYFAKPGLAEAVLRQRREATRIRLSLGLPEGTIIWHPAGADGPDVQWECIFENATAQQHDLAQRDASAAFGAVRSRMDELLVHSERLIETIVEAAPGEED